MDGDVTHATRNGTFAAQCNITCSTRSNPVDHYFSLLWFLGRGIMMDRPVNMHVQEIHTHFNDTITTMDETIILELGIRDQPSFLDPGSKLIKKEDQN